MQQTKTKEDGGQRNLFKGRKESVLGKETDNFRTRATALESVFLRDPQVILMHFQVEKPIYCITRSFFLKLQFSTINWL